MSQTMPTNPLDARTRDYARASPMLDDVKRLDTELEADAAAAYVELLRRSDEPQPGDAEDLRAVMKDLSITEEQLKDDLAVLRHADELEQACKDIADLVKQRDEAARRFREIKQANRQEIKRLEREIFDADIAARSASNRLLDARRAEVRLDRLRINYPWLSPRTAE